MSYSFDVASVLAALILAIGGVWAYRNQKRVDRAQELLQKRREIYIDFVSGLVDAANGNSERHLRARIDALMVGSDGVLRALKRYNDLAEAGGGQIRTGSSDYKAALAAVVLAMREDVFEKSEISVQEFNDLLPVKR